MGEEQNNEQILINGIVGQDLKTVNLDEDKNQMFKDDVEYLRFRKISQITGTISFDITTNRAWRRVRRTLRKAKQKAKRAREKRKKHIKKESEAFWRHWHHWPYMLHRTNQDIDD